MLFRVMLTLNPAVHRFCPHSKRAKLIYIQWIGPSVKVMVKSRVTGFKAKVQSCFPVS